MADTKTAVKKGLSIRLTGLDGSNLKLQVKVNKGTGAVSSCVVHSTAKDASGKRVHALGASQVHPTREKAEEAVNAILATALRAGWTKPATNGFAPKADAFDLAHLPGPGKPVVATTKK